MSMIAPISNAVPTGRRINRREGFMLAASLAVARVVMPVRVRAGCAARPARVVRPTGAVCCARAGGHDRVAGLDARDDARALAVDRADLDHAHGDRVIGLDQIDELADRAGL